MSEKEDMSIEVSNITDSNLNESKISTRHEDNYNDDVDIESQVFLKPCLQKIAIQHLKDPRYDPQDYDDDFAEELGDGTLLASPDGDLRILTKARYLYWAAFYGYYNLVKIIVE